MKKTNRLGRGLNALIPEKEQQTGDGQVQSVNQIEVARIKANPFQPRMDFDPQALRELKSSIKEKGVIQPVTVREVNGGYELISGERRLRAVTELGVEKVPAYIIEVNSKEEMLELAIIENVQREKLNPIEQAVAYQRLIDECNLTQEVVAQKIGKDRTTITNMLRLLKLPENIQQSVQREQLSMGHARALLAVDDEEAQQEIWKKTVKNNYSVRKLEKIIKNWQEGTLKEKQGKSRRSVFIQKVEDDLRELFGTKVNIRSKKEGGSVDIEFYSPEDLNRLLEIFEKIKE